MNSINNFIKNFIGIKNEFGSLIFPLISFNYFIYYYGLINLYFILRTYKDPDIINAICMANLYINDMTIIIIIIIIGSLDTLASNAYREKNYKLIGIYFDRCRYICILFWGGISLFHYFFARNILGLFKVKEKVIKLILEYLSISVFSVLINLNFLINQKHFSLIDKSKINFYISIFSLLIQTITGYLLVVVFKFGVRGSALSYFFAACFNSLASTIILIKMNLPEGSLVFFTKNRLKEWKKYLNIAIPGILVSGGDLMIYEFQSIFAINIPNFDYSAHVILINLENLFYPFTSAITSVISKKSREKLMKLNPEQLRTYILMIYLFKFLVLSLFLIFEFFYFYIISTNDEIYLKCGKIKYVLSYFIFADKSYYFYLECFKGFGFIRNTIIKKLIVFFGIGPLFIIILAFINKMGVKDAWENTSIALTMGNILFKYLIYSSDFIKITNLAKETIRNDNKNIFRIKNEKNIYKQKY